MERRAQKLTVRQLAERSKVSVAHIEQLERCAEFASTNVQERLAAALGVAPGVLFEIDTSLSAGEAAKLAGVSIPTLLQAIESGELRPLESHARPSSADSLPAMMGAFEAAQLAGVCRQTIHDAIRKGRLPATRAQDGSWQIEAEAAVTFANSKRKIARHRIPVDEVERWAAAYWSRRASAHVELRCDHCGRLFNAFRSRPAGAHSYCSQACYLAARRAPLIARAGGCGSPTCRDPACTLDPGSCHRPECDEAAYVAGFTAARHRWVLGYPTVYCSRRCAVLARNKGLPWAKALAAFKQAEGLIDAKEAGRRLNRAPAVVMGHARRLGVGRRVEGFGRTGSWLFSCDDLEQIDAYLAASVMAQKHEDPLFHARWYKGRFGSTRVYGRRAGAIAAARGKKVGRPSLPPARVKRILELHGRGKSQRQIACLVKVSRDQVRRIVDPTRQSGAKPPGEKPPGNTL